MRHPPFFLFLLLLVPSTVIFAELHDEEMTSSKQTEACEYHSKYPNELFNLCEYKLDCEGLEFTYEGGRNVLEKDYLTQLFLQNNPWGSINTGNIIGNFDVGNVWLVGDKIHHEDKNLGIGMNMCNDITRYSYQDLILRIYEKGDHGKAVLNVEGKNITDSAVLAGEGKYEIAKRIIGKHASPKVQINEFGIPSNRIHCNDGLELFERSNNVLVCIKPQTFEKLVERGFDIKHYPS